MIKLAHINTALDGIDMFEPVITIRDLSVGGQTSAVMAHGKPGDTTVELSALQVATLFQFFQDLRMAHHVTAKYRWYEESTQMISNAVRQFHLTQEDLDRERDKQPEE